MKGGGNMNTQYTENNILFPANYSPEFLGTKDVAKLLKCSAPMARAIMRQENFPLVKVGKNYKVEKSAFLEWSRTRHID